MTKYYTPRILIPGMAHHVCQRGNRREAVFPTVAHYTFYLELLMKEALRHQVLVLAYCLMPNHVHLILKPQDVLGIPRLMRTLAQNYARHVNEANGWTGHLWEKRYFSAPMDDRHLYNGIRYVLSNPVRAELAKSMLEWPFSSARAHLSPALDPHLARDLDAFVGDWVEFFGKEIVVDDPAWAAIRRLEGRVEPVGALVSS